MKGKHPAIFPKSLVEKCINVSGCKQGVVFDPFMGTGTTCLVAQDMGLRSVGVEIDFNYYEFACDKLQELF